MSVTQDSVKDWLKKTGRSRQWLADKCDSALQTVNNWLGSDRGIPAKAVLIIENLMAIDEARSREASAVPQNLVLEFSQQDFDAICEASSRSRMVPRVWAQTRLNELARMDIEQVAAQLKKGMGPSNDPCDVEAAGKVASDLAAEESEDSSPPSL